MSGLASRHIEGRKAPGDRYPVDIVFVVDATESMNPILDRVKANILRLAPDLEKRLKVSNKALDSLQARIIAFRDLWDHPETAFETTKFFRLPEQQEEFKAAVDAIEAHSGNDPSESGLEALFLALRSPWRNEPQDLKRRHIVVVFTDQDAHELGAKIPTSYAQEPHPKTLLDLKKLWGPRRSGGLMNERAQRLVLFAPEQVQRAGSMKDTVWAEIAEGWPNVVFSPDSSEGLDDTTWDLILSTLVGTL